MDLDLGEIGAGAFRDKVREILASRPFAQVLEARGIAVERVSEPKQTDTTQRWKMGLRVQGAASPLPTKIECSRPRASAGRRVGRSGSVDADPAPTRDRRLPRGLLMVNHYDAAAALRQKSGRSPGGGGRRRGATSITCITCSPAAPGRDARPGRQRRRDERRDAGRVHWA